MSRQQRFTDLGFPPIYNKAQHGTRRLCSRCGRWISVIELGFCRYRFVEISYTIEYESTALPYITIVHKYANHICTNTKDSFHAEASVKGVHSESNNNRTPSDGQSNKPMIMEVM